MLPFLPAWSGISLGQNAPLLNLSKLLLVALVIAWALRGPSWRKPRHPASRKWRLALVFLALVQALSLVVADHKAVALVSLAGYIGYYYLIYLCAYDVIDSVDRARQFMLALAISGSLVAVAAILESITGTNLWHGGNTFASYTPGEAMVRYGFARASAAFGNYLSLGIFLGMVWPLWLVFNAERRRSRRFLGIVLAAFGFVATWSSVSRGPIIAILAALLLGAVVLAPRGARLRILAAVAAAGSLLMLVTPGLASTIGRGANIFTTDTVNSADTRARLQIVGPDLHLVATRPLLGYGVGEANRTYETGNVQLQGVRSFYMALTIESGVLALIPFCYFLLGSLVAFVRRTLRTPVPRLRTMYLALALSVTSVAIALASVSIIEPLTYLFALIGVGHRLMDLEDDGLAPQPAVIEAQSRYERYGRCEDGGDLVLRPGFQRSLTHR